MNIDKFKPDSNRALMYHIKDLPWSIFGTITFNNEYLRNPFSGDIQKLRELNFHLLLDKTCSQIGFRSRFLDYYYCTEYGISNNAHIHFLLINHKPLICSNIVLAWGLNYYWNVNFNCFDNRLKLLSKRKVAGKGGLGVIGVYKHNIPNTASNYIFKREFDKFRREKDPHDQLSKNLKSYLLKQTTAIKPIETL